MGFDRREILFKLIVENLSIVAVVDITMAIGANGANPARMIGTTF